MIPPARIPPFPTDPRAEKYFAYIQAYWKEIHDALHSTLRTQLSKILPQYMKQSGNVLIFPAVDGLVGVHFPKEFRFQEPQFNGWLHQHSGYSPFASIVNCSHSKVFSVTQWVQIFCGNFLVIKEPDKPLPGPITVNGFPSFPPVLVTDERQQPLGLAEPLVLQTEKISNLGISLRDVKIEEVDSDRSFCPFLWCQLDIYGDDALENLIATEGKLKAQRELLAIVAGHNMGLSTEQLGSQPSHASSQKLRLYYEEYQRLLAENVDEAPMQAFFEKCPAFLFCDFKTVLPQAQLGIEYRTDFIFTRAAPRSEECIMVEIESPQQKLFTKTGDGTQAFNHAIRQVQDWRSHLTEHHSYICNQLKIRNLHNRSKALIVIGRSKDLSEEDRRRLQERTLDSGGSTEVVTYDEVGERALQWIKNWETINSRHWSP